LAVALVGALVLRSSFAKFTTARAVGEALAADFNHPSVSVTLSLSLTPAQIQPLVRPLYPGGVPPQAAQALSVASLTVDLVTGHGESLRSKQTATDSANQCDVAFDIGGTTEAEVRQVNQTVYARVDLPPLLGDVGLGSGTLSSLDRDIGRYSLLVPGLSTLADGGWISVPHTDLGPLLGATKLLAPNEGARAASTLQQLVAGLKVVASHQSRFTNAGDHGGRTEYLVSVPMKTALSEVTPYNSGARGFGCGTSLLTALKSRLTGAIPRQQRLSTIVWVKDSRAQEVDVNLNQFGDEIPFRVPMKIVIAPGHPIAVPPGATPLGPALFG
jgi:hypothetical protein